MAKRCPLSKDTCSGCKHYFSRWAEEIGVAYCEISGERLYPPDYLPESEKATKGGEHGEDD